MPVGGLGAPGGGWGPETGRKGIGTTHPIPTCLWLQKPPPPRPKRRPPDFGGPPSAPRRLSVCMFGSVEGAWFGAGRHLGLVLHWCEASGSDRLCFVHSPLQSSPWAGASREMVDGWQGQAWFVASAEFPSVNTPPVASPPPRPQAGALRGASCHLLRGEAWTSLPGGSGENPGSPPAVGRTSPTGAPRRGCQAGADLTRVPFGSFSALPSFSWEIGLYTPTTWISLALSHFWLSFCKRSYRLGTDNTGQVAGGPGQWGRKKH